MTREGSIVGTLVFMLYGPILWALHLLVSYGSHASLCAAGDRLPVPHGALPWILGAATATVAAGLVLGLLRPGMLAGILHATQGGEPERAFSTSVMRTLSLLSLFGIAFAAAAITVLPLCDQLR